MSDRPSRALESYTAPQDVLDEFKQRMCLGRDDIEILINALDELVAEEDAVDPFAETASKRQIVSRQTDYQNRRFKIDRESGVNTDAFAPSADDDVANSYADAMRVAWLEREEQRVYRAIEEKERRAREEDSTEMELDKTPPRHGSDTISGSRKRRRWDVVDPTAPEATSQESPNKEWSTEALAGSVPRKKRSRWDATPADVSSSTLGSGETSKRSRWDQTPMATQVSNILATPLGLGGIPSHPMGGQFPVNEDKHNRYLSDEELDAILPTSGYIIVAPPEGYALAHPSRKHLAPPTPLPGGFQIQDGSDAAATLAAAGLAPEVPTDIPGVGALAFFKPEDAQYFGKILKEEDESEMSVDELKERKIMRLLLKIKNGTPPVRKTALRQITDKAREFGAGPLFDKILPLLMERTLEDQERHLLVKVIDRVLYKLDDLVRPYVHKILVVIEPLLIDEDYYARVEGREIISNLSKAAGLAHMISTMRPDIDHVDEYVRNTTARAFSVVASALGIPSLLPFLKAVCRSKKSWQARHTGIRIVQQIAIMMGCAVLPHLRNLVEAIAHGLTDEQQKVRTMTALGLAALAEAAAPYGIESFDSVLKPLWLGIRQHRGKGLAAFLKAIGFIIPLMDPEFANYYTKEVTVILIREFQSSDEEMKKIVLKVVKQCAATEGVTPSYIKADILPEFFKSFWVRLLL